MKVENHIARHTAVSPNVSAQTACAEHRTEQPVKIPNR